jgi:hypothetical protein
MVAANLEAVRPTAAVQDGQNLDAAPLGAVLRVYTAR